MRQIDETVGNTTKNTEKLSKRSAWNATGIKKLWERQTTQRLKEYLEEELAKTCKNEDLACNFKLPDNFHFIDRRSAIYLIFNTINGKKYIGSAKKIYNRRYEHFRQLGKNEHHSKYLQQSYNKYGASKFIFIALEDVTDVNNLIVREQWYMDNLGYNYNIHPKAGSSLGTKHTEEQKRMIGLFHKGKIVSPEARRKMSVARANTSEENKQKFRENGLKLAKSRIGKRHTLESRLKMSLAQKGRGAGIKQDPDFVKRRTAALNGIKRSKETIEKIKQNRPNKRKINQFDLSGNLIKTYTSIIDAKREMGLKSDGITQVLLGNNKTCCGWIFKYADDNNEPQRYKQKNSIL